MTMITNVAVKILIADKNPKVGAMARALAFAIGGQKSVSGTSNEFLDTNGFYEFHFASHSSAKAFRQDVEDYLGQYGARVQ